MKKSRPGLIDAVWPRGPDPANGRIPQGDSNHSLITALAELEPEVRAKAARTLGEIKDPRAVAPLMHVLRDQHSNVRFWAAWALGAIKDPRALWPLITALQDPDEGVRYRAAEALGRLKDRTAIEPLQKAAQDSGEGVCLVASWALNQINTVPARPGKQEAEVRACLWEPFNSFFVPPCPAVTPLASPSVPSVPATPTPPPPVPETVRPWSPPKRRQCRPRLPVLTSPRARKARARVRRPITWWRWLIAR